MTPQSCSIQYGNRVISFSLSHRQRATLEISVEPDMRVVVIVPVEASLEDVLKKVRKRAAWICRQQRFFAQFLPRTPARRFLPGETHLYLGRQYRLKVTLGVEASVKLARGFIQVQSHKPSRNLITQELVENWYRAKARAKFAERLEACLQLFPKPEAFRPKHIVVKALKQRWGSLSPSRQLTLNRRLIEAPVDAIDYVITHELCHMAHQHHGPAFFKLLDRVMPDWQKRKERLERFLS